MKAPIGYEITLPVPLEVLVRAGLATERDGIVEFAMSATEYRSAPLSVEGIPLGQFVIQSVDTSFRRDLDTPGGPPFYLATMTCVGESEDPS